MEKSLVLFSRNAQGSLILGRTHSRDSAVPGMRHGAAAGKAYPTAYGSTPQPPGGSFHAASVRFVFSMFLPGVHPVNDAVLLWWEIRKLRPHDCVMCLSRWQEGHGEAYLGGGSDRVWG